MRSAMQSHVALSTALRAHPSHLPAAALPLGPAKIATYLGRYHDAAISHSGLWRILKRLRVYRTNGVSGSTARMGRKGHDDRHTGGREPTRI